MAEVQARSQRSGLGVWVALLSAAMFGSSGGFAKSLLVAGWSPAAVVTLRIAGAAAILFVPTLFALRGRWGKVRSNAWLITAYGLIAVAGCQLAYFNAVRHLSVGVALLLEYLAPVLIVALLWARGQRPARLTLVGVALAVAGLLLVLDVAGGARISAVGVVWGLLAATGLVGYFLMSAHEGHDPLPPIALAGMGLVVGAVALVVAGVAGVVPMEFGARTVEISGNAVSWLVPILELATIAAAFAYATGIAAVRMLGSTVSSFVALTEVLFAVVWAWALLGELPRPVQLAGGVLIVGGVIAVRVGDALRERTQSVFVPAVAPDFAEGSLLP